MKGNDGGGMMGSVELPSIPSNSQYDRAGHNSSQVGYDKEMVEAHMTLG